MGLLSKVHSEMKLLAEHLSESVRKDGPFYLCCKYVATI